MSEPTPKRQAELQSIAEKNIAAGRAPYQDANIISKEEVEWLFEQVNPPIEDYSGLDGLTILGMSRKMLNLSGAHLMHVDLHTPTFHILTSQVRHSFAPISQEPALSTQSYWMSAQMGPIWWVPISPRYLCTMPTLEMLI